MPNHCNNKMTVSGPIEILKKFRSECIVMETEGMDAGKELTFDANAIVPMPEDLSNESVGGWCGDPDELIERAEKDLETITDPDRVAEYEANIRQLKLRKENVKQFGVPSWYEWKVENWGNKWGAYSLYIEADLEKGDEFLLFSFDTAWAPFNDSFVRAMGEKYPKLSFEYHYYEPGMCFAGSYMVENGGPALSAHCDSDDNDGYMSIASEHFGAEFDEKGEQVWE